MRHYELIDAQSVHTFDLSSTTRPLCAQWKCTKKAHLPACRAVAVAFVLEICYWSDHPIIDLSQSQPLLGRAFNSLSDEIRVRVIAPGIPTCRGLPWLCYQAVHTCFTARSGQGLRGHREAVEFLVLGSGFKSHNGSSFGSSKVPLWSVRFSRYIVGTVACTTVSGGVILFLGNNLAWFGFPCIGLWSRERPRTGPWSFLWFKIRIYHNVQRSVAMFIVWHLSHDLSTLCLLWPTVWSFKELNWKLGFQLHSINELNFWVVSCLRSFLSWYLMPWIKERK